MSVQLYVNSIRINPDLSEQAKGDLEALHRTLPQKKWVWIQNNEIKQVTGLLNTLKYLFFKSYYDTQVGSRVNSLVNSLDQGATRSIEQFVNFSPQLQILFFSCLSSLNGQQFDRSRISFNGGLEKILCPELTAVRANRGKIDQITGKNFSELVEEAKFALRLGVAPKLATKGCGGTYFVKDRQSQVIAIFKPSDAGPQGSNNPRLIYKIKALFSTFFQPPGFHPNHIHYSEVAASYIDRKLNLGVVPFTDHVQLESPCFQGASKLKKGSFQVFVKAKEASVYFPPFKICRRIPQILCRLLFERTPQIAKRTIEATPANFEKIALLDMVIGNIDRTFDNWMVLNGPMIQAIAIDHATAFPKEHVKRENNLIAFAKEHIYTRNCNLWRILPSMKKPFSEALKSNILESNPQDWVEGLREVMTDREDPSSVLSFPSKMAGIKDRVALVQKMTRDNSAISEMGKIKRQHQFDRILKKDSLVPIPQAAAAG